MATIPDTPAKYLLFNDQNTKNIVIVVEIPGIDLLSSRPVYTKLRYGDPGVVYGGTNLVYGGLRRVAGVRDLLSFDGSSLTIQQVIEPEQGRGSVQTITMAFVDKDEYMSQVVSPGVLINEILGKPVKIWLGYQEISYPDDYQIIFRGIVTQVQCQSGRVTIQFSDPNTARRQTIFYTATTKLTAPITNSSTTIPVITTSEFNKQILGPNGMYDAGVQTWIQVDDEYMQYGPTAYGGSTFTVTRSAVGPLGLPTVPDAHDANADVKSILVLKDNPLTMALKLMLSGYNGFFQTGVPVDSFVYTGDPILGNVQNGIVLKPGKSATRDLGLSIGDYITISSAVNPGNDITVQVVEFGNVQGDPNRLIYASTNFTYENPSTAFLALRSKYDVYPLNAGLKVLPSEVDVARHEYVRNTFIASDVFAFKIDHQETGKTFIESELYLPASCYGLTRQGLLSVGITTPPIADERIQYINSSQIIEPQNIAPQRGLNVRKFFNLITWDYDVDLTGAFRQSQKFLDTESLSIIGLSSTLPIQSRGGRTDLGFDSNVQRRSLALLNRYKRGATQIQFKITYGLANLIEAGDVVVLEGADLSITNFQNGTRTLGSQLYEVINRTLDIKTGQGNLTLISNVDANFQDKFATIAPSSHVDVGSTTTDIYIRDSFGVIFPLNESKKYQDYIGLNIRVHSYDYSFDEEVTLVSIDPSNPYHLTVSPPLSAPPPLGYIIDLAAYSTSTDPLVSARTKLVHAFWDPSVFVTANGGVLTFQVGAGDIGKFVIGQPIYTHQTGYGPVVGPDALSDEAAVTIADTGTDFVTVATSLGYSPLAGDVVELIGFPDGGPPYRFI